MSTLPRLPHRHCSSKSFKKTRYSYTQYVQKKRLFKRKIQRAFFHLDPEGIIGGINFEAFKKILSVIAMRLRDEEVLKIFHYIDSASAKKGYIHFVEFMKFIQTPFHPADQIRLDMLLHMHHPAYFQKYHTWHVDVRPLGFKLVPGPNYIGGYFWESSNAKMNQFLERGSCLCFINTARVDRTYIWDIQQILENMPCPFSLTFRNLCLPDMIEEKDNSSHPKLVRKELTKNWQHLIQQPSPSFSRGGRGKHLAWEHPYFGHCVHCPSETAWYLYIHLFMEDETFSAASAVLMYFITFLIFVSTAIYIMETIPNWQWRGYETLEAVVSILFTIELAVRISSCRNVSKYMGDPLNIIDFCAVFPYWIELMSSGSLNPEMLRMIRIVRLLRLVRLARSTNLTLTVSVFTLTWKAVFQWLVMFIFFLILGITIFSSFQFFVESGVKKVTGDCGILSNQTSCSETVFLESFNFNQTSSANCRSSCEELGLGGCCLFDQITGACVFYNGSSLEQYPSPGKPSNWTGLCHIEEHRFREGESSTSPYSAIPYSMWWAAATVNMVGYGEIYPVGNRGRILGAILSIIGLLCMAFPLIVVGQSFKAAIVRVKYRLNVKPLSEARGSVMDLLGDINAVAGEKLFESDDELVFLVSKLDSKRKVQQILSRNNGWGEMPFAQDGIYDTPRISQFKLYVLYGLYGRRFRSITHARKRYRRAFRSKLHLALQKSIKRKMENISEEKIDFGHDIPLTVRYKCRMSTIYEFPKNEDLPETLTTEGKKLISEAKDQCKVDELTTENTISREESPSLVVQRGFAIS